ncbi:MAG TPA: MerR family transcriptional regulator [Sphingomonadales bacterium]|nr:MerR family transcriptional regulator [Sphingomonadales bacterium]
MKRTGKFTIGKLSKLSGCVVQTIRYYELIKLLPNPDRSPRGHRLYSEESLTRLKFILRMRQLGFNLESTREFLTLIDGETYTCHEIREKTLLHAGEIKRKIEDLHKMEIELLHMAEKCNDDTGTKCSILEALFQ